MASSPLVVGENVIVNCGGQGSAIVAIDRMTGKRRWSAGNRGPGYSSPTLMNVDGQAQVVCFTATGAAAFSPSDGTMLWGYPFQTDYDCNTATPIQFGENVFISAGENHGSVLLRVKSNKPAVVWESINTKSVLRCEWQTAILLMRSIRDALSLSSLTRMREKRQSLKNCFYSARQFSWREQ